MRIIICLVALLTLCSIGHASETKRHIVGFLLDETGSMEEKRDQTIDGFNEYLKSLQNRKEKIDFTLIQFNAGETKVVCDKKYVEQVGLLNRDTYTPDNMTPLYDAIGNLISVVEKSIERTNASILCVIFTDGLENQSKEYTKEDILKLIKEKEKSGWTFAYLGANQDAWAEGGSIGIYQGSILDWDNRTIEDTFLEITKCSATYFDNNAVQTDAFFSTGIDVDEKTK